MVKLTILPTTPAGVLKTEVSNSTPIPIISTDTLPVNDADANLTLTAVSLSVDNIDTKTASKYGDAQVVLGAPAGNDVVADSSCLIQADLENRKGWQLTNPIASKKFNLYFFSGANEVMTLGDLKSLYSVGSVNTYTETYQGGSMFFFNVYTKKQNDGLDAGSWYRSRINYHYNHADNTIGVGEECVFYCINEPTSKFSQRKIKLNDKVVLGEGLDSEEILTIACSSNSGTVINALNVTLNKLGFNTDSLARNLNLATYIPLATEATLSTLNGKVTACDTGAIAGTVAVSGVSGTVAVSVQTLPLPTSAATETTLTNGNQLTRCMGNNAGSQVQLKVDANGVLATSGGSGGGGGVSSVVQILGSEDGTESGIQHQVRVGNDGRTHTVLYAKGGTTWSPTNVPLQMFGSALNVYVGLSKARFTGAGSIAYGSTTIPANTVLYRQPTGHSTYSLRSVVLFGKTTNLTDPIYFAIGQSSGYSNASYPRYRTGDSVQPDPITGEFYKSFPNYSGEYISWEKANTTGVTETITVNCNGTP